MRTHMHHLTAALAAALIAWSGPAPLPASDYEASDYLPLAVGNSWTFLHWVAANYAGFPGLPDQESLGHEESVTITVERTEVIGDTTYYVLSDVPAGFLAPPPHCPVGKKLRWKGSELMERTDTGERSFFRFEGPPLYTVPLTHGDDEVIRRAKATYHAAMGFTFRGHDAWDWVSEHEGEADWYSNRLVNFLAGYGLLSCHEWLQGPDYTVYDHVFGSTHAVLVEASGGGASGQSGTTRTVRSEDALKNARRGRRESSAAVAPSSWGKLKGSAR